MKVLFCGVIGASAGMVISAAVFALITATGLMPRFIGKTHTEKHSKLFQNMVVLGGSLMNAAYIYRVELPLDGELGILFFAIGSVALGMFVGSLAVSLAEALKATSIFSRRIKLSNGMSIIILTAAISKMLGAIYQFFVF